MSDQVVGSARVRIEPDARGFDTALAREVSGSTRTLGRLADVGTSIGERLGSTIARGLKIGLTTAVAGAAAVLGAVLFTGFKRFADIEDATRSLTIVLGSAQKAGKLLGKVLKTVEGTPFALNQFTTVASNLAGLGVKIETIPDILTAIGDAAAASGRGAAGVDILADAFGRIAVGSKLMLGPIRDLEQQGIPALKILANQAGISADKMAKNISKGSVDSEKAIAALVKGIEEGTDGIAGKTVALAGVAKGLGETTRGALANLQIAFARTGANILKVFDAPEGGGQLARVIGSLSASVDTLGGVAVDAATQIVGSEGFGKVLAFFEKLPDKVNAFAKAVDKEGFRSAISDLFSGIDVASVGDQLVAGLIAAFEKLPHEKLSKAITSVIVRSIAGITEGISEITAAVVQAAPAIITGIAQGLIEAAQANPLNIGLLLVAMGLPGIGPAVTGLLAGIFSKIPIASVLAPLIRLLGSGLQRALGTVFTRLGSVILSAIGPALLGVASSIGGFFVSIGAAIAAAIAALPVIVVVAIVAAIALIVLVITTNLFGIRTAFADFFTKTLPRFFTETIPKAFAALVGVLSRAFETVRTFIVSIPGRLLSFFQGLSIAGVAQFFATLLLRIFFGIPLLLAGAIFAIAPAVIRAFQVVFGAVINFFKLLPGRIVSALVSLGGTLVHVAATAMSAMARAIVVGAVAVFDFFRALPGRVGRFLIALPGQLATAGRIALVAMGDAVIRAGSSVLDFFRKLPGRIGGLLKNVAGFLVQAGKDIIAGLIRGIKEAGKGIAKALLSVLPGPIRKFLGFLDSDSPSGLFEGFGKDIIAGLVQGVTRNSTSFDRALGSLVPSSLGTTDLSVSRGSALAFAGAGITQNVTVNHVANDTEATARAIAARLGQQSTR